MFRMAGIPDFCGISIRPNTVNKHKHTVLKHIILLKIEWQKVKDIDIDADKFHWASAFRQTFFHT